MSPEQALGESHRVEGRSDIFSLGVVFFELLTGRLPFRGSSVEEILDKIVNADVRPPRQIDDVIPKELERICLKCLAKRVGERYTTAKDLAEDLRFFLAERSRNPDPWLANPAARPRTRQEQSPTETGPKRPGPADAARSVVFTAVGTDHTRRAQGTAFLRRRRCRFLSRAVAGAAETATACPRAFASGRARVEETDPTKHSRSAWFTAVGMRQIVADEGGACCRGWPKTCSRLRRGHAEGHRGPFAQGAAQAVSGAVSFLRTSKSMGLAESLATLRKRRSLLEGRKVS